VEDRTREREMMCGAIVLEFFARVDAIAEVEIQEMHLWMGG
jgi:hypothetical protein